MLALLRDTTRRKQGNSTSGKDSFHEHMLSHRRIIGVSADGVQVSPGFEQVGGEAVPQLVGIDTFLNPGAAGDRFISSCRDQ